jgi:sulfate permease, SulP family
VNEDWPSPATIWRNIVVGLAVSFVALSLGAAFGILSGRGATAGMISAGLISVITGLFGGTRVQCSGPTAPMGVITAIVVATAFDELPSVLPGLNPDQFVNLVFLVTAGILALMGILRLGRFISLVPNVVVSGFMNGIALLVWASQLRKLFGGSEAGAFSGPVWMNAGVAGSTLALIFLYPHLVSRLPKHMLVLIPPGTLVALVVMTVVSGWLGLPIGTIDISGGLSSWPELHHLVLMQFPTDWSLPVLVIALPFALQLAVLCYLDTLLTSLVVDRMTGEPTRRNQELVAQGAANGVAALVGGIPGAQATIRSVLVIKEGGTLRLAGVCIGLFVLAEMIVLLDLIAMIPQAVFAGILFKVGYDVFDLPPLQAYIRRLARRPRQQENIFVAHLEMLLIGGTTILTLLWDLNVAVALFTGLFYLINKVLRPDDPVRDLKPDERLAMED